MSDFPFGIYDLIPIMNIETKKFSKDAGSVYAKCPLCNDKKFRMKIFGSSDSWVCFHCGEHGGMLDLYAKTVLGRSVLTREAGSEAYQDILQRLGLANQKDSRVVAVKRVREQKRKFQPVQEIASISDRNATYKALLGLADLDLTDAHYEELYSRGFSEEMIELNQYRSFSKDLEWACNNTVIRIFEQEIKQFYHASQEMKKMRKAEVLAGLSIGLALEGLGCTLKGVPGFYRVGKRWLFRVCADSILIPLRNDRGQILGLQLRLQSSSKLRYMTVSSRQLPDGCAPAEYYHFPLNAAGYGEYDYIVLTEGPLKGDALSALCGHPMPVLCITGVNMVGDLPKLFGSIKSHGINFVINALDMDRLLNKNVRKAMRNIRQIARKAGLKTLDLCWDQERASQHCEELLKIAQKNDIVCDNLPDNVFKRVALLAERLDEKNVPHTIRWDAANATVKRKGIDDAWLTFLRSQ